MNINNILPDPGQSSPLYGSPQILVSFCPILIQLQRESGCFQIPKFVFLGQLPSLHILGAPLSSQKWSSITYLAYMVVTGYAPAELNEKKKRNTALVWDGSDFPIRQATASEP